MRLRSSGPKMMMMLGGLLLTASSVQAQQKPKPLQISGVYPHLAVFNDKSTTLCGGDGGEGGIGAITPWAGRLWMITYSPHCPYGSSDKLYSITNHLKLDTHPQSIGGTPANRMIHKESQQLITSNYFIDAKGNVRTIPFSVMPGRMTATARHLADPANMVYFYDMEGMLYEANVHTLAVNKLFHKPVPGWHGKGAYTAQNRLIVANNGEEAVYKIKPEDLKAGALAKNKEEMGVLASWDGKDWSIIERKQFTDVTGPGGIYGNPDDKAPAWSIGWDKRSVILKLLDNGVWYSYRLPKATQTYDHRGGWYTEWPRIREIGSGKMLMDMHGMFYDFPKTFSRSNSGGISPISTHLRYIPDFTSWKGKLVLATDETTILANVFAGRAQSNLWFGTPADLKNWGAASAWGGPWMNDVIKAGEASDAFLTNGFEKATLHLQHDAKKPITFTIEVYEKGNNQWKVYKSIAVDENGYANLLFPTGIKATWVRIKSDTDCTASAYFYFTGKPHPAMADKMFNALAAANETNFKANLIRPAAHNTNLQVLPVGSQNKTYLEVDENLSFIKPAADSTVQMHRIMAIKKDFEIDEASVIVKDKTGSFRLPKGDAAFDKPFNGNWPRGHRELESERLMLNAHGTFYEIGREAGYVTMRPVSTHNKKIMDFATWRGLLVLSGTKATAIPDGHYFNQAKGNGLWFGAIDDLWKLGKPRGQGGVWKNTSVKAGEPSLPFLMAGYDKKKVSITSNQAIKLSLEIDFNHKGWSTYKTIDIPAGKNVEHVFPDGFSAHWIRAKSDKDCTSTVWFTYE